MRPTHLSRRASYAIAFAVSGCGVSATTTSPDSCADHQLVPGCTLGSGYTCTGSAIPAQSNSALNCSPPIAGSSGSRRYCCLAVSAPTSCAPVVTASICPAASQGFSCSGPDTPDQSDSSLGCIAGASDNGSTMYCCAAGGAEAGTSSIEADGGSDAESGESNHAESDGGNDAESGGGNDAESDGGNDASVQFETGADGGSCAVTADTGNATCDQCVDSMCCTALVVCGIPDDAGTNDAGTSACGQLLGCTLDCVAGTLDAGQVAEALSDCQALCNPTYTMSEQANASALLQCLTGSCAAQCP